jgi:glutamate--cysteine ligase
VLALSNQSHAGWLAQPLEAGLRRRFDEAARDSLREQRLREAADTEPFETFRQKYLSPERLVA